jgi:PAS domain S-box-containing protein
VDPASYRTQAELTTAAFEEGPDAILVVDSAGVIRMVNRQAEMLTGRHRDSLVGQPVESLIPADLRDAHVGHRTEFVRSPRRRLMGPGLDLAILQRAGDVEVPVPVDVNLAPTMTSIGLVVVATVRLRGDRWGAHG